MRKHLKATYLQDHQFSIRLQTQTKQDHPLPPKKKIEAGKSFKYHNSQARNEDVEEEIPQEARLKTSDSSFK
jgi:hypothetical protein